MFEIIEAPIKNALTDEVINNRKGLFVNGNCVNVVSDRYKVIQPETIKNLFESKSQLDVTNTIVNENNGSILLSADYKDVLINNEEHKLSLTMYTGHNNQYSTFVSMQALRIACLNQVPALIGSPEMHLMKCKHVHHFDFDELGRVIDQLPLSISNFEVTCQRLKESNLTLDQFLETYVEFFKLQQKASLDKTIDNIRTLYKSAKGQEIIPDNTAYKGFHALTYDLTHNVRESKHKLERSRVQNQKQIYRYVEFLQKENLLAA